MTDFEAIVNEFSKIDTVKAIALSGSVTTDSNDELSDFDLYIYTDSEIPLDVRKCIFEKYAHNLDLDNRYWELGDEMHLNDTKKGLDIMYRDPKWIEGMIENVYDWHNASLGYTTCFLHNVASSKILFDSDNWFKKLQDKVNSGYPEELAKNIIEKNLPLLRAKQYASYYEQIKNALARNDYISVNHRLTAFFASYFDVIFAYNRVWHPGEKRLVKFVLKDCKYVPVDFEKDIVAVLCAPFSEKLKYLDILIEHLYELFSRQF